MTARILLVDDIPANTQLLHDRLSAEYYDTETATTDFEAMDLALSWQPDLILLDNRAPGLDGYQTCKRLKSDSRTLHIPVVMITALGDPMERLQGLEVGADEFLTKPVDCDTMLARVRGLVRMKRMLDEWRVRTETAHALGQTDAGGGPEFSVVGARALVVDDSDLGAMSTQEALSRDGIVPGRARTATEAIALTDGAKYDLIVLSLSLSDDDPLLLAARLRAARATHEIPLLLIAEPEQRTLLLRGFDLGACEWVLRPVDEKALRVRARNHIRRKFYRDRLRTDLGDALEIGLTDPITGLYNQRYLSRHLCSLLAAGQPGGIAVLMIDIDHFKAVNDRWGRDVGDKVLRQVAETLRGRTRVFDSLARYGGREFVVVMAGASATEASRAAERLRAAVEALAFYPKTDALLRVTISIGITRSPDAAVTSDMLLSAADRALYRAQRAGRNRIEIEPLDTP